MERPSTPLCADLPETGKRIHKSSLKVTVQFGIILDDGLTIELIGQCC